jgi:hypothetical protein
LLLLPLGKLYHELHTVNKPLPPGWKIQIDLHRTSDNLFIETFAGASTTTYKVDMTDICLFIPKVTLSEVVVEGKFSSSSF